MNALERESRDRALIEMYLQGARVEDVADEFGLSCAGVAQVLQKRSVKRDPNFKSKFKYRSKVEIPDDKVTTLWNAGLTIKLIAERYGVSRPTVHAIAKRLGLIDPKKPRHEYAVGAGGGTGRSGFAGSFARRT